MFYQSVKAAWDAGKVHVGLPAFGFRELAAQEVACVAAISSQVDDWTPEQREIVRSSVRKFGFPLHPPSHQALEVSSPQHRLLEWQSRQLSQVF